MNEEYISKEVAILTKQKNYNTEVITFYHQDRDELEFGDFNNWNTHGIDDEFISAPSQANLQKWLRETHFCNVVVEGAYNFDDVEKPEWLGYYVTVEHLKDLSAIEDETIYQSYEEAVNKALERVLEVIS